MKRILIACVIAMVPSWAMAWTFTEGRLDNGAVYCSVSVMSQQGAFAILTRSANQEYPMLLVRNTNWPRLRNDLEVEATIAIDGVRNRAVGRTFNTDGYTSVGFELSGPSARQFAINMFVGNRMTITFHNGAPGLNISLIGSAAAMTQMGQCVESRITNQPMGRRT